VDTITPLARPPIAARIGWYSWKLWCMIASPLVAVISRVRTPISPRAGW